MAKRPSKPDPVPAAPNHVAISTISPSQERLIGQVAVEWAKLEATLEDLIWQFLGLPIELGRNVTARLGAETKVSVLRSVAQVCYDQDTTDFLLWCHLKELIDQYSQRGSEPHSSRHVGAITTRDDPHGAVAKGKEHPVNCCGRDISRRTDAGNDFRHLFREIANDLDA